MKALLILTVLVSGCGAAHAGAAEPPAGGSAEAGNPHGGPTVQLVKFSRPGCVPCQQIAPAFHAMAREGLPVVAVDTMQWPELAAKYRINSVPTFVLLVGGREVWRDMGVSDVPSRERELRGRLRQAMRASAALAQRQAKPEPQRRLAAQPAPPAATGRTATGEAPPPRPRPRAQEVPLTLVDSSGRPAPAATPEKKRGFFDFFGGGDDEAKAVDDPFLAAAAEARTAAGGDAAPPVRTASLTDADFGGGSLGGGSLGGGKLGGPADFGEPPASAASADPLRTAVRIEVPDARGVALGSGTVIDSRPGRSVVLTCGHVLEHHRPGGTITVHSRAFGESRAYPARLIMADKAREVGLLEVVTPEPLPHARLAPLDPGLTVGDYVVSVGSDGGDAPTKQNHRVNGLDLFKGPSTVACTGQPVEGRSGGGLFDARGELVGVCWAREETPPRGIYSAAKVVYEVLDEAGLSDLHPPRPSPADPASEASPTVRLAAADSAPAAGGGNPFTDFGTPPADPVSRPAGGLSAAAAAVLAQAGLEVPSDVTPGSAASLGGAVEITCVIRSLDDPSAPGEVVVIQRATPRTLRLLMGAAGEGE